VRRPRLAAILAAATLVEPHIGLPACLTLFCWLSPTRRPFVLTAVALAAASVAAGGLPLQREYFANVLPSHAHSEVSNFASQYSLTSLLYALGATRRVALAGGSLSYLAMLAAGLWLARRLQRRFEDEAFFVLTPPALALVGGVFIHLHQMAAAIPLALAVIARTRSRTYALAAVALFCLAVPWESFWIIPGFHAHFVGQSQAAPAAKGTPPLPRGDVLAETAESAFVEAGYLRDPRSTPELLVLKTPTWFGLLLLVAIVVALAREASPKAPVPPNGNSA
jgi:hypothetical protein